MIQDNNDFFLQKEDVKEIIPVRNTFTHKYDYGHVKVIAGSKIMSGAAALCSNAALKMGAGIVKLITPKVHASVYPEVIVNEIKTNKFFFNQGSYLSKHSNIDTIVIGPGITYHARNFVRDTVQDCILNKYLVLDADAITSFTLEDKLAPNVVLTPHFGEISKLRNNNENVPLFDKVVLTRIAKDTAQKMNCIVLLKGTTTIITDGTTTYYNSFGNPGMATAGSGDVLAGMLGANIAKLNKKLFEMDLLKVVALTSLLHSLAGDYYAEHNDMETLIATDIINSISNIIKMYK
ncbi:MAG: NAD(P)H-hydrate dehydratase [Bacteroidetes bacterium]|nr:NAD(P)H-hydrate dehydratase [Bacteroidota bacterium]